MLEIEYKVDYYENSVVMTLPRKIVMLNSDKFKVVLQSIYDLGYRNITLDCKYLQMIDTNGIGGIIMFQKRFKDIGGELKMVNVNNDYINYLFDKIQLNKIIDISKGGVNCIECV